VELSSRVEYALLALLQMSNRQPEVQPLKVSEIAALQSIPGRYLDQILILLGRSGLVQSQRGAKGGYLLAKDPRQITLWEIMTALEGEPNRLTEDAAATLTLEKKAVRAAWEEVSQVCQDTLSSYTLHDLCQQLNTDQPQL
jgi:Rrf2 family protein